MLGKFNFLFIFSIFIFCSSINASLTADVPEYEEVSKIIANFNSIDSAPANLFSVFLNANDIDIDSRYSFITSLQANLEKIHNFGDFPYNPKGKVDQNQYEALERRVIENRKTISSHFNAIDDSLKYVSDILSRYQYMGDDDKQAQSITVIKHVLGQSVTPDESLQTRLPMLSGSDCLNWVDSELQLLVFQYENNDPENIVDFEDYSKINLAQCLNYIATGYSMLVSAKQANGDADAGEFYERYSAGVNELISTHQASVRKMSIQSARKTAILDDMYEKDAAFTISYITSFIFIIAQLLIILFY